MRQITRIALFGCCFLSMMSSVIFAADDTLSGDTAKLPDRAHCKISMARVNDPNPPLNLRSSPAVSPDNVVGKLEQGKWLVVIEEKEDWFRIAPFMGTEQAGGWVIKSRTEYDCSYFRETITTTPITLRGRFIGMGAHEYLIRLEKGQTLILTAGETSTGLPGNRISVYPFLMDEAKKKDVPNSPNSYDTKVTGMNDAGTQWRWLVSEAGMYRFTYQSDFKGFEYNLNVMVQ